MATRAGLVRSVCRRLLKIDKPRDQPSRCVVTQKILKENLKIGIVGVPMEHGQRKIGVGNGPDAIRDAGLLESLADHRGLEVKDYGNLPINMMTSPTDRFPSENVAMRNVKANAEANRQTADSVVDILGSNDVCVALGGDHSMAIGTISGHASVNPNMCVLWVDAHPDLNIPSSSPTGNIHGMPLHFVLNDLQNKRLPIPAFEWCKANISSSNIGMIAIRDIDPGEIELMKRFNIPHCSIREIDRNGIAHCMEMILDMINPCGNRPIHLSFDIDSLDPLIAPSTGTPVHGGLSHREAMYVCEEVARTGCLSHLDLVEVNPDIGSQRDAEVTAKVAVDVVTHALGLSVRDTDYRRFPLIHRELRNRDD